MQNRRPSGRPHLRTLNLLEPPLPCTHRTSYQEVLRRWVEFTLHAVAEIARARNCGRFEWAVLDWNAPAIDFYRSLGATVLPDWRIVRVVGPALDALAEGSHQSLDLP